MSCHKKIMNTRVITFWREHVTSLITTVLTKRFLIENNVILKVIKFHFKGSYRYDKQKLILEVISYEIYETRLNFI